MLILFMASHFSSCTFDPDRSYCKRFDLKDYVRFFQLSALSK